MPLLQELTLKLISKPSLWLVAFQVREQLQMEWMQLALYSFQLHY